MKLTSATRFMLVAWAIPLGGILGFVFGGSIVHFVMGLFGRGNSHDDMITVASFSMLAIPLGVVLIPVCTWLVVRRYKEPIQPPQTTTGSSTPRSCLSSIVRQKMKLHPSQVLYVVVAFLAGCTTLARVPEGNSDSQHRWYRDKDGLITSGIAPPEWKVEWSQEGNRHVASTNYPQKEIHDPLEDIPEFKSTFADADKRATKKNLEPTWAVRLNSSVLEREEKDTARKLSDRLEVPGGAQPHDKI